MILLIISSRFMIFIVISDVFELFLGLPKAFFEPGRGGQILQRDVGERS